MFIWFSLFSKPSSKSIAIRFSARSCLYLSLSQLSSFDKSGARFFFFFTTREMIVDDYEQPRRKRKSFGLKYFGESPPNILYHLLFSFSYVRYFMSSFLSLSLSCLSFPSCVQRTIEPGVDCQRFSRRIVTKLIAGKPFT